MSDKICKTCGFPKDIDREPVFMDSNPLSIASYLENTCEECGHQRDGSTIPVVAEKIREVARDVRRNTARDIKRIIGEIMEDVISTDTVDVYEAISQTEMINTLQRVSGKIDRTYKLKESKI